MKDGEPPFIAAVKSTFPIHTKPGLKGDNMSKRVNRRDFIRTSAIVGGLSALPMSFSGCSSRGPTDFLQTLPEYDIFPKFKTPKKLVYFDASRLPDFFPKADAKQIWLLHSVLAIFQGLVNRIEPRIYLNHWAGNVDWLSIYKDQGHDIAVEDAADFASLIRQFAGELDGYIIVDPDMLHSLNVAQTWGALENWMAITPDMQPLVKEIGLPLKEDLRGRWPGRVPAYEWAFEHLFPRCSKHLVANCCVDFPYPPSGGSFVERDFYVANKAFVMDLSAALRQRREYRLMDKIYAQMQLPGGVWGWHDSRDHEHWAVERASRKGLYTLCNGMPNLTVHGGVKPKDRSIPRQQPSPRKNLTAEKNKIYIAFLMTDGDSLWVMQSLQQGNWGPDKKREFPISWGFLPLLADIAPQVYKHYIDIQQPNDYMFCGPAGAGYTYTHLHPEPRTFLRYSKHYMQRCGLDIPYITNWNDYTNWQEVDVPWFNPILFKELDNCIGFVRGMGESAFDPNYNFKDKPFVFCGEGLHMPDKDDVATIRNFIDANPNRPLFIALLVNVSIPVQRMRNIVSALGEYDIDYVRLDDFMHLTKSAFKQGMITEDLYPNRKGNEEILSREATEKWPGVKASMQKLAPVLKARTVPKVLGIMNAEKTGLAKGQRITEEDMADVLAFALCKAMFDLVKNVLNQRGIYVNERIEAVNKFMDMFHAWRGVDSLSRLINIWQHWDELTFRWGDIAAMGRGLLEVYEQAEAIVGRS